MASQRSTEDSQSSHGFSDLGEEDSSRSARCVGDEAVDSGAVAAECSSPAEPMNLALRAEPAKNDDGGKGTDGDFENGPRVRMTSSVILRLDGLNYQAWKVIIPSVLDSQPYALGAVNNTLLPPPSQAADTPEGRLQQWKYDAGNRAARCILFGSIQTELAVL